MEMIKTSEKKEFKEFIISKSKALNKLLKEQEECLLKLLSKRETGFRDRWEYTEWHRDVIALELSQINDNEFLDDRAFWELLLKDFQDVNGKQTTKEIREELIFILHNKLEIQFAKARIELSNKINEEEEIEE